MGTFAPGHKKKGGRTKGTPNKKTEQWEQLGEQIIGKHSERFSEILEGLNDVEFMDRYIQVLNYFKPKLRNTESKIDSGGLSKIIFEDAVKS